MIMITKQDIKEILALLKTAYPNSYKDMTKEKALLTIDVWYEMFNDCKKDDVIKSIKRLINKCKYLPSIAEIKSEMALIKNKELQLNPEEEWELVLKAVRKWGKLDNISFNKITQDTIRAIGQNRLEYIETSQIPFIKKEFIDIWLSKRDGIEHYSIQNKNTLSYKEQLMLEQKEIDKQCLLEMER